MIAAAQLLGTGLYSWRFVFHDALTGAFIDDLPLEDVEFEWDMPPTMGDFTGYLRLGDERVHAKSWRAATQVRRTVIHAICNDVLLPPVWMLWDTNYDPRTQTLQLNATEAWSYYHRRTVDVDRTFAQREQLDIFRTLLEDARTISVTPDGQSLPAGCGDIRVSVDTLTTGILRDRSYLASEAKDLGSMCEELANVIDGFDFVLEAATDSNGAPLRRIRCGYPRLGVSGGVTGIMFSAPGNISTFSWPSTGSSSYTLRSALGDNSLRSDAVDLAQLQVGVPLLEHSTAYTGISDTPTLQGHAQADLAVSKNPSVIPSVTARTDLIPYLGGYNMGDDVLVQIEDPAYFPNPQQSVDGLDWRVNETFRLMGIRVRPDQQSAQLTLNSADVVAARMEAAQQAVTG